MRKLADVNAHRTAHRDRSKSNGSAIQIQRFLDAPEVRPPQYVGWQDYFLPRKEARLMADEASRTGGVFMPWPLLAIVMSLIMALGGGIIGLYTQLSSMQTTMILRDSDFQRQVKDLKDKQDQMEVYLHNDREKIIGMQEQLNRARRGN